MSNTLTTMTGDMVLNEVMPALKLGLSPLNALSYETSESPKNVGDVVSVPVVTAKSAGTYSSTFATGDTTTTGTDVTLLAPTFSSWYVNPNLEAASTGARFLAQGREAAYAVAKSILQAVLAKFVTANIGDTDTTDSIDVTAANYDVDDQATLWGMLKTKGVAGSASAIHNISYATALLKDAALQDVSASGSMVLQTGELPTILGARQFYTDAFPTALTNENTGVIYTGKETCAVALAVPNQVEAGLESAAGVRIMQVTDPDTGLSMIWRTWLDSATGAYWGSVYCMYGVSFHQDAAVRILSA